MKTPMMKLVKIIPQEMVANNIEISTEAKVLESTSKYTRVVFTGDVTPKSITFLAKEVNEYLVPIAE